MGGGGFRGTPGGGKGIPFPFGLRTGQVNVKPPEHAEEAPIEQESRQDVVETFIAAVLKGGRHASERARAEALVRRWCAAWQGPKRNLLLTRSNHGWYLHFNQLVGRTWVQAFGFHADQRHGLIMRGPDTDRERKAHYLRANRLEKAPLDALFEAWSAHPDGRPAGLAVEFFLNETTDETWEACLQEALQHLGA